MGIGRAMQYECVISPIVFNLYREWSAKEALEVASDSVAWQLCVCFAVQQVKNEETLRVVHDGQTGGSMMELWNGNKKL